MIELAEALNLASQLKKELKGKTVLQVLSPSKPHKFCWFNGDAADYDKKLKGLKVTDAFGFGIFAEICFEGKKKLCFNDGVNVRFIDSADKPKDYQLFIEFDDKSALLFTVAMYGSIILHEGEYDSEYYLKSKSAISPFSDDFCAFFHKTLDECEPKLSMKAFMATQQRFPGIGNGSLQDILFEAHINPKRKISTLSEEEKNTLLESTVSVLKQMADLGGRDTERDIYAKQGGYKTKMSKLSYTYGCPNCNGDVTKESYLGGTVYYCAKCQPIERK